MDDREFERRMEDYHRRNGSGGSGDDGSDIIVIFFLIAVGFAALVAGLGWVDDQFGWGLRDALMDKVSSEG